MPAWNMNAVQRFHFLWFILMLISSATPEDLRQDQRKEKDDAWKNFRALLMTARQNNTNTTAKDSETLPNLPENFVENSTALNGAGPDGLSESSEKDVVLQPKKEEQEGNEFKNQSYKNSEPGGKKDIEELSNPINAAAETGGPPSNKNQQPSSLVNSINDSTIQTGTNEKNIIGEPKKDKNNDGTTDPQERNSTGTSDLLSKPEDSNNSTNSGEQSKQDMTTENMGESVVTQPTLKKNDTYSVAHDEVHSKDEESENNDDGKITINPDSTQLNSTNSSDTAVNATNATKPLDFSPDMNDHSWWKQKRNVGAAVVVIGITLLAVATACVRRKGYCCQCFSAYDADERLGLARAYQENEGRRASYKNDAYDPL